MKSVVKISIVGKNQEELNKVASSILEKHLIAGMSISDSKTAYWLGGQLILGSNLIMRGITFYDKIQDIEKELPDGVSIISACPSTYVNPKTERWLNESIR